MFIPTWLLVLIIVVILTSLWPTVSTVVSGILRLLWSLIVLSSIGLSWYLFAHGESSTGWVVSIPWLVLVTRTALRGSWRLLQSSLWWHNAQVCMAGGDALRIQRLRVRFADRLELGEKVWQLSDDCRHFPSWYRTRTNTDGPTTTWTSAVIAREDIQEFPSAEEAASVTDFDPGVLDGAGRCLVYTFNADKKGYALCSRDGRPRFSSGDDGEPRYRRYVWIIEKPNRLVLKLSFEYGCDDGGNWLIDSAVEAFKPGPWLFAILDIAERVHVDEHQKTAQWLKQWERKRAEKNFLP